jgi:ribosome maturation factor RimP
MATANTPEEKIEALLQPLLEGSDMFLTAIRIKATNNVKVFLDADSGLDIGKSATINRKLYHAMEEAGIYPDGDFSLEVSSPGVDEPLRSLRQYKKNVGRTLEVTPLEGEPVTGVLKAVDEENITIAIKGTKKSPPVEKEIALNTIKTSIVQISF